MLCVIALREDKKLIRHEGIRDLMVKNQSKRLDDLRMESEKRGTHMKKMSDCLLFKANNNSSK